MIAATHKTKLAGIAQLMPELSNQICTVFDASMDLEISVSWYDDPDPRWGGPPTKENLIALASQLRQAYMNIAALTGLDPCEQFQDTKTAIQAGPLARKQSR